MYGAKTRSINHQAPERHPFFLPFRVAVRTLGTRLVTTDTLSRVEDTYCRISVCDV